jgi:hypothetical protein
VKIYTQKKAEIMSEKKTLEEQMSDLALGNLEWVEPLKNWLDTGPFLSVKSLILLTKTPKSRYCYLKSLG